MTFAPDTRAPGVVQQVILERDGGLADLPRRVALVGYRSTAAGAALDNMPTVIDSRAQGQSLFGAGSQLDLMIRSAFQTGNLARRAIPAGGNPEIIAVALPPPAGVQAEYTITYSGAATAQGSITVEVNEQTFSFTVLSTDGVNEVASSTNDGLALLAPELPLTASAALGVVTLVVRENGEYGNDIYLAVDDSGAPGITATIAQSVTGSGVSAVVTALAALQDEQFIGVYVVGQDDTTTRAAVLADVQDSWTFGTDRPRHAIFPIVGDASDAETETALIDDYRIIVSVGEKFLGVGQPYSPASSRSMAANLGAGLGSRLYSRSRPNANYNRARIDGLARDFAVTRQELDDAINGGVTMLVNGENTGAEIVRAVTSAVTDQTPGGSAPDKRWQPFEITRVIQEIWWQTRALLDVFASRDRTDRTRAEAKAAALGLLRSAAREGWISEVTNESAIVTIEVSGGATQLVVDYSYSVITNTDVAAVTHRVRRA